MMNSKETFRIYYNYDICDTSRFHYKRLDAEYFDWLFSMLAGTGVTFMYRCNLAGRAWYRSKYLAPFDHSCVDQRNEKAAIWHRNADVLEGCDPLAEAVRAARRHGVPVWAWFNWNEFHNVRQEWVYLIDPLWYQQTRKFWCSRDGSRFYHGVPAFGDPEVVARLTGMAEEVMSYGVDGLYLSTRSHSWYPCWGSPGWDKNLEPFGFNDCVVDAYRKRHGVDIRYEDYDNEEFLKIKGEHFSALLARTGAIVHGMGKEFIVGIAPDRYTLMVGREDIAKCCELYKDWEGWLANGSIDGLCSEHIPPHEKRLEGGDISLFKQTLREGFPLYSWMDTASFHNRNGGPYSLANWDRNSVEEVLRQIEMAKSAGASGVVLHSFYHFTACDTKGESIGGYGVLPRTEYFDALRKLRA